MNIDTKQAEMKKSKSKKGLFLLILLSIWLAYALHNGFCLEQRRKLTDKELFTIVFNELLKTGNMKIQDFDNTAETYLAHHPNCCRVYGNNLLGFVIASDITVDIIFEMSIRREKEINTSGKHPYYESITYITACGKSFRETGEATTALTRTIFSIE